MANNISVQIRAVGLAVGLLVLLTIPVRAQVTGQCVDGYGVVWAIYSNPPMFDRVQFVAQNAPLPSLFGFRDPTGMHVFRFQQHNGLFAFVQWNGQVIGWNGAWQHIAQCSGVALPQAISHATFQAPVLSSWGVRHEAITSGVPNVIAQTGERYVRPMIATPEQAAQCMQQNSDRNAFADCMANKMMSPTQQQIYSCLQAANSDEMQFATCIAANNSNPMQLDALHELRNCQRQHGTNWQAYPLCAFSSSNDPNVARGAQCLQQQLQSNNRSVWGFGLCYAGPALQMNAESQIAVECAMSTGGQPVAFVGCAGGRLTARELERCFTHGIGGNGCFGDNNDIVKAFRAVGIDLRNITNPNGAIVGAWNTITNDIQNGPGPNNDIIRTLNNAVNDITRGPGRGNDIVRVINGVLPGFDNLFN